ncbi:urease accessory protein UreD [Tersicoccus sp. MR15.9]|uniref:urease accessory protein UreD n=1 Tax=Tersicoccus mangrovi TaxID=3121635 RepID=UPI002FE64AD9
MSGPAGVSVAAARAPGGGAREPERFRGELELTVEPRHGRSVAGHQFHRGALRVLRPLYLDPIGHPDATGQVTYVVVNPGGAYLDGDRYRIQVTLAPAAQLLLTGQAATKIYRTPRTGATQTLTARLAAGSRFEYLPDQLIAYRGARYRQDTRVEMDPSASLVLADVVTPGWSPGGEPFRYDALRLRTAVTMEGRSVVVDNLQLAHGDGDTDPTAPGLLEGRTHVGTLLVVDPRITADDVDAARAQLARRPELLGGATTLAVPGLALRVLGDSTGAVTAAIHAVVDGLRAAWYGQGPVDLRKY